MPGAKQVRVDATNTEQARAWDGDEGAFWAGHAERFDRAVAGYNDQFLAAADIEAGDHVLDIGCGTGQTTRDAARLAPRGRALGVDLSGRMIDYARQRAAAEAIDNVEFEQADAQVHPFDSNRYDVAISRTGAMFFGDPIAAFTNIRRALRAEARLVLLTWQPAPANEWFAALTGALAAGRRLPEPPPTAPGPFSLGAPERIDALLTAAGFADVTVSGLSEPMWFGTTARDAAEFTLGLLGWLVAGLDEATRAAAVESLWATVAAHETPAGVLFGSSAWLVHARSV